MVFLKSIKIMSCVQGEGRPQMYLTDLLELALNLSAHAWFLQHLTARRVATVMIRQNNALSYCNLLAQDAKKTRQAELELVPLIVVSSMPNCISHKFSSQQGIIFTHILTRSQDVVLIIIIFVFYRDYHKKQDHLKLLREKVSLFFIVVIPFVFVTYWYQMLFQWRKSFVIKITLCKIVISN